ncbi:predicted protein [Sclerotinia sclerotiorum 1980 UF-70]|uniref:Uncharacterized protein n=1 Tax=Sclerotinia sclerotiorum (strain ATCC 18683 / 1980 / Ss-1) TaxID=665079 RepID=A7EAZ7_SCLS1|nr:predicted protein [Sclerotinia sclerotiorum 1980 UF-70]EDN99625.1 predicted protein [Sclerotinia sclerotiorum 1980 UF-70]
MCWPKRNTTQNVGYHRQECDAQNGEVMRNLCRRMRLSVSCGLKAKLKAIVILNRIDGKVRRGYLRLENELLPHWNDSTHIELEIILWLEQERFSTFVPSDSW